MILIAVGRKLPAASAEQAKLRNTLQPLCYEIFIENATHTTSPADSCC